MPKGSDYVGPDVHRRARETWGFQAQIFALAEELCEAAAQACRLANGKANRLDLLEELVDVQSLTASVYDDLGTEPEWESMRQEKRRKLLAKLDGGVKRV